jgi:hypothetical protein
LKQLHPDWQLRAHIGWDEEAEDDSDYRIDHVYIVATDGTAYDCRGRFDNEQELVGPDETGGVETQFVDYSLDDIKNDIRRGELKSFTRQDIQKAIEFSKRVVADNSAGQVLDEMPLPVDWDQKQFQQQGTTFKSRLAYALERAKKIGTGSSRVATTIEYQGRPTVLKIAKNTKGLAQNSVEASMLDDGYASQMGILIPLIDYDTQHRQPLWIHTELATKASESQLCNLMHCDNLGQLINFARAITGNSRMSWIGTPQSYIEHMKKKHKTEEAIEIATDYANKLAELSTSFDIELGDLDRAANWGLYQGKPVILDVGGSSEVIKQYYRR